MREVKYYMAFDGKLFEDKKKCSDYEEKISNYMMEIIHSFAFYNAHMKEINYYFENLEGMLDSFEWAWQHCYFMRKITDCSQEALDFIQDYFGYPLPDEFGLFSYRDGYPWIKVDE